ncbi:excinuclease ABC subunit UvrA [Ornithinibacillus salinisoli]|uniref:UvrABC system protein A n=1 Tax=Ornithinibacillus salinisoli TaxID=1848459 RepID=A0ABW4VW03_9BACI
MKDVITNKNAHENNLKHVTVNIPKNKMVVLTGPSGSGKSTLAMDILQLECQRHYMESSGMISSWFTKPKVESISGLSPSISVGQHITNRNPRSTVGTVTDMYTYLRMIYEKLGERTCPNCHTKFSPQLETNAEVTHLEETHHDTEYVNCPTCNYEMERLTSSHFSFNTIAGACETCSGLGEVAEINTQAVFNEELSLRDGAVRIWYDSYAAYQISTLEAAASFYGIHFNADLPLKDYDNVLRDLLYYGVESDNFMMHFPDKKPPKKVSDGKFEGVLTGMWRRYKEKAGDTGEAVNFYKQPCNDCHGERLREESRQVKVEGTRITDISQSSLHEFLEWLKVLQEKHVQDEESLIETILHDLINKVTRVVDVGLGYLSMDRQAISLSGGESQRLRLASILGSGLTGVLYILDEPTSGLHPKDTKGLISVLRQLRDLGNTVLVIEHNIQVMEEADHIIDMGPGAGQLGGSIVGEGELHQLVEQPESITGAFLRENSFQTKQRRESNGQNVTIHQATKHNLKNITVSFPLNCFITVTGVSGSGKSTLVYDLLAEGMEGNPVKGYEKLTGLESIKEKITVDQSPLSRMRRSNVATYTDAFTFIRNLFAKLPEAKQQKLTAKNFSFNTTGGRCEKCEGLGTVAVNMYFLPDLEVRCPSCKGKRFKDEILSVTLQGYSISDILHMSIEESLPLFRDQKKISTIINLLCEVGLGYLQWGQSLTTLSGGEGQRLKLAKELNKTSTGHTLYILDEPSTGLHPNDVRNLLLLLNKLVDAGNTVIVVEHNSDIIRDSDWVIDMGPNGGEEGGQIIAEGTPEQVAATRESYTGAFLDL